jgi:hypothetical protein
MRKGSELGSLITRSRAVRTRSPSKQRWATMTILHANLRRNLIVESGKKDLASQEGSVEAILGVMRIWVMSICGGAVKIGY